MKGSGFLRLESVFNTGQFKKNVTLSHVYNEVTSEPTITRHTTIVLYTERLVPWSRHSATQFPLAATAPNTFSRQLQTNFDSFPNDCCISRDCRLIGYWLLLYKHVKVLPSFLIALYLIQCNLWRTSEQGHSLEKA
jgi:hypothetical protein